MERWISPSTIAYLPGAISRGRAAFARAIDRCYRPSIPIAPLGWAIIASESAYPMRCSTKLLACCSGMASAMADEVFQPYRLNDRLNLLLLRVDQKLAP